jgi:hypothetical protein
MFTSDKVHHREIALRSGAADQSDPIKVSGIRLDRLPFGDSADISAAISHHRFSRKNYGD